MKACIPAIRRAFATPDPARDIDPIAERIRKLTGASFVVVANKRGVRYSHPNPANIGKRVSTDPTVALAGDVYVGYQEGTLGRSLRAKVPIVLDHLISAANTAIGFLIGSAWTSPEASPASSGPTAAIASIVRTGNVRPPPMPNRPAKNPAAMPLRVNTANVSSMLTLASIVGVQFVSRD